LEQITPELFVRNGDASRNSSGIFRVFDINYDTGVIGQRLAPHLQDYRFLAELLLPRIGVVDGARLLFSETPQHEVFGREFRVVL
jgi:hypothetical protein